MSSSELDYEALFDHTPTPYLVLTPELVIVGMNKAREQVTERRREDVIGQHFFEAFPDPPDEQTATGVQNLRASLERVLATKRPDTMPMQKYDLEDPAAGEFTERWWSPVNVPILDDDGEVVLLVHRVTEVTEWMRTRSQRQEALEVALEEADSDLYARAQELHAAWVQASADVANFRAAMLAQRARFRRAVRRRGCRPTSSTASCGRGAPLKTARRDTRATTPASTSCCGAAASRRPGPGSPPAGGLPRGSAMWSPIPGPPRRR